MTRIIRLATLFVLLATSCLYAQRVPVIGDGGGDPPPPPPGGGGTPPPVTCSSTGNVPFQATPVSLRAYSDVGIGANGSVWAIGPNGVDLVGGSGLATGLFGTFTSPAPTNTSKSRIAVGADGSPWIVDDNYNIYHLNLQTGLWTHLPGLAVDIAVTSDGTTWVTGTLLTGGGHFIYFWNGSSWIQVSPGSGDYIAGGPNDGGQPWVTNDSHVIYHRNPNGTWTQTSSGLGHDIAIGFDGSVWTLGTNGTVGNGFPIWHFSPSAGWVSDPNITGAISIAAACGTAAFIDGNFQLWSLQARSF